MNFKLQAQGIGLVFLGAASYGILATIVKYSNILGIHTSVLTLGQFMFGALFLVGYAWMNNRSQNAKKISITQKSKLKLMLFGTSTGLTSCFYYSSLQFIPVSFAIVLLMQSIWMGVLLEGFLHKRKVEPYKLIGAALVLFGTVLAANVISAESSINLRGLILGLIAAMSYTVTLYASSHIETHLPSYERSKYLVFGGLLIIIAFWNFAIFKNLTNFDFVKWGLLLALFGTILPPLLFTKGIPIIGIGMGAILASVELPISILSAKFILGENMNVIQWSGVLLIIVSVIVVNKQNLRLKIL